MTQSEQELEQNLCDRLVAMGYESVNISNADQLKTNLKTQLEKHNHVTLSNEEFRKVLNHLDKGNVFERSKTLRDKMQLTRDDRSPLYLEFLNIEHWCQNQYQVTHQIAQEGNYKNRYDVTLLINGLPLVQIELKRRGLELKEAFNQINRYQRHSFTADNGLFQYVQIFVISNGVNTRYYANNRKQEYKKTSYWADAENNLITQLDDFTDSFLEKCHLSKMICKYIVLHESDKVLMVLRPYQYYAVEAITKRVKETNKNGYIWHTTGSGKTLTSFKAAQILTSLPTVHKVVFVVDRADLDYQTSKEFNHFSPDCVDNTNNTSALVRQMAGENTLIVTTIQKLNTAIKNPRHETAMEALKDKRIVFIFDECHRSQFGETHKNIVKFFNQAQLFGFTGTPIFAEKNYYIKDGVKLSTASLFEECLHKYVITNAIADENVLKFSVEYWGKLKRKDGSLIPETIADKEFFENPDRISMIVDWIIEHHSRKTHNKQFSAILCVSNIDTLITYYELFKQRQKEGKHDLRIVTAFTSGINEDDADANGLISEPDFDLKTDSVNKHSRDKLAEYIADYNQLYQTQHSAKDSPAFYAYYKDIAKRMKDRDKENFQDKERVDILLVVNMFLTGFDVKKLNTLYVDKNLKYHGLIQAYSRTNRVLGELKSQGNIACFRNLKENTDQAIILFSNENAQERIFIEPYEHYVQEFNESVEKLKAIAAIPDDVNKLISEEDQVKFVKNFRELIRSLNVLKSFTEFDFNNLNLDEQSFEDYKSKYLDIYERTKTPKEKPSLVEEIDFELELIRRDEINVAYILALLANLRQDTKDDKNQEEYEKRKAEILDLLGKETQLRNKRPLIEKFIDNRMPTLKPEEDMQTAFSEFWNEERRQAVYELSQSENMDETAINQMINTYHFSGKEPLRETVFSAMKEKPKLLERQTIFKRISSKLLDIINKFDDHTGNL